MASNQENGFIRCWQADITSQILHTSLTIRAQMSLGLKQRPQGGDSMSKEAAEHHRSAAHHYEHAAQHHHEAAKHHEAGDHQAAAHHAHIAQGHQHHATHHATEAAKSHAEHHGQQTGAAGA